MTQANNIVKPTYIAINWCTITSGYSISHNTLGQPDNTLYTLDTEMVGRFPLD